MKIRIFMFLYIVYSGVRNAKMSLATFAKANRLPLVAFGDPSTFDRPLIFEAAPISFFLCWCFHHFSSNMTEITQHVCKIYTAYYVWDTSVISIQFVLEFRVSKNTHYLGIFILRVRACDLLNLETRQRAQFHILKQKWRMEIPSVRSL